MRICSGKFEASAEVYHVQGNKKMRLSQPQQMMAQDRHVVDEAYAEILSACSIRVFSPSAIQSALREERSGMKESLLLHRNILPE